MQDFRFVYDEDTDSWKEKKEPYITIEIETEEDYEYLKKVIDLGRKVLNGKYISVDSLNSKLKEDM